ncbi:MAG: tol-pal system YbgF family protein, partial [Fidelibacterota bacterium]
DSIRIKSLKSRLTELYYRLGEIYLYNLSETDSAIFYFNIIFEEFSKCEIAPKSLLILGQLYRDYRKDINTSDSLYKRIIELYPGSDAAEFAKIELGVAQQRRVSQVDSAKILYENAEKDIFIFKKSFSAIKKLNHIEQRYSESPFAPKALYAKAWIYDFYSISLEKALENYNRLIESYPDSEYVPLAKNRIARLSTILSESDEGNRSKQSMDEEKKGDPH